MYANLPLFYGDGDVKLRALAFAFRFGPYIAAVGFYDLFYDEKPKAGAVKTKKQAILIEYSLLVASCICFTRDAVVLRQESALHHRGFFALICLFVALLSFWS